MRKLNEFFNNAGSPKGRMGKIMVKGMNKGHTPVSKWGISHIPSKDYKSLLDIGCGGGINLKRFEKKYPSARIYGLDASEVSVAHSRKVNQKAVKAGRIRVYHGKAGKLPFLNNRMSLVTAFETIYFWPDLLLCFKEVYRVLEAEGVFVIVNELGDNNARAKKWTDILDNMVMHEEGELRETLLKAGFQQIRVIRKGPWICVVSEKGKNRSE